MTCKGEQENHEYVKISETASSFNQQVFDIITDRLAHVFSLVERVKETTYKKKQVFKVDTKKSKKRHLGI